MTRCTFDSANECITLQVRAQAFIKGSKRSGYEWKYFLFGESEIVSPSLTTLTFGYNICMHLSLPFSSVDRFEIQNRTSSDTNSSQLVAIVGNSSHGLIFSGNWKDNRILARIAGKLCQKSVILTENGTFLSTLWLPVDSWRY